MKTEITDRGWNEITVKKIEIKGTVSKKPFVLNKIWTKFNNKNHKICIIYNHI